MRTADRTLVVTKNENKRRCPDFVHYSLFIIHYSLFIIHSSFLSALSVTRSRATSPGVRGLDLAIAYTEGIAFVGVDLPDDPKTTHAKKRSDYSSTACAVPLPSQGKA